MGPIVSGVVNVFFALQATQATVAGVVRDQDTGEPLAGATVALTDLDRATRTGGDGRYALALVPPGPQHLMVRAIGYAPRTLDALVPQRGQLDINVSVRRLPFRLPAVDVRSRIAVRGVDSGDSTRFPDRGLSIAAIMNDPKLAEVDVLQALGGGEVLLKPEAPSGVHIRGGGADHTAYVLDGVPVFSPYHAAGVFSAWNADALSRVQLSATTPALIYPDALSGTIAAVTRTPGDALNTQGGITNTQMRFTADGPLGVPGVTYLFSMRTGFPAMIASKGEAAYLRGETRDALAKLEAPVLGGRVRLLGYESENEITSAAFAESASGATRDPRRHRFDWRSRSLGAEWQRQFSGTTVRLLGWQATSAARSDWIARAGPLAMAADRSDGGVLGTVEHRSGEVSTMAGVRMENSRTSYRVAADSNPSLLWRLGAETPTAALLTRHTRPLGLGVALELGASVTRMGGRGTGNGGLYFAPRTQLQWEATDQLTLSASYARTQQFAQSLRNSESVVGGVFPADLYIGANAPGVPVARSAQTVVAADYRPLPGVRVGAEAYHRDLDGLVLVAPRDGEPFSTQTFALGAGSSRGVSLNAAVSAGRYGVIASYAYQRVRLMHDDSSYTPEHGAPHLLETGVIVFPTPTWSLRLGATAAMGRRATALVGGLEWESCNILDEGCEFGGNPNHSGELLGASTLPDYFRVDLGFRKHWHLPIGERDAPVALFATVTNVFNRANVLRYARDPAAGRLVPIEMRPLAPLVVGLDWRY